MKNEIIIYESDELTERNEVKLEDDTVWLSQEQKAMLFKQTKQNICSLIQPRNKRYTLSFNPN
jgi:hypothetical protein